MIMVLSVDGEDGVSSAQDLQARGLVKLTVMIMMVGASWSRSEQVF